MSNADKTQESESTTLCKACGLCCTGHLFTWVKLKPAEMAASQSLGLNMLNPDSEQQGFSQPCALWQGQCTIYDHSDYPTTCKTFKCKLLKQVQSEKTPLTQALSVIQKAKGMIGELEALLPLSIYVNFRERLIAQVKNLEETPSRENADLAFRMKTGVLLIYLERHFGVKGWFSKSEKSEHS